MMNVNGIIRKKSLIQFGFGTDVMKATTVCINCNSMESTDKLFCSECGARLPGLNLYDYYRAQHKSCRHCRAVISETMNYCPKCGFARKSEL